MRFPALIFLFWQKQQLLAGSCWFCGKENDLSFLDKSEGEYIMVRFSGIVIRPNPI